MVNFDAGGHSGQVQLSCGFSGLRLPARIGAYEAEKLAPQDLLIDLKLHYDAQSGSRVMAEDNLEGALDYANAAEIIRRRVDSAHHALLEYLAGQLLSDLRKAFPACLSIDLQLAKPQALPGSDGSFCSLHWSR